MTYDLKFSLVIETGPTCHLHGCTVSSPVSAAAAAAVRLQRRIGTAASDVDRGGAGGRRCPRAPRRGSCPRVHYHLPWSACSCLFLPMPFSFAGVVLFWLTWRVKVRFDLVAYTIWSPLTPTCFTGSRLGMPFPKNLQTAMEVEAIVRDNGSIPATIAILDGVPHVGQLLCFFTCCCIALFFFSKFASIPSPFFSS